MKHDVIVVGGGYAGMAAALQLLRARKTVLMLDAGKRRNRFANSSHGFLGQDGIAPDRIAADAREQLAAYPELDWIDEEAGSLAGKRDAFEVITSEGKTWLGRRILFATGVEDRLPEIDGIGERWGKSVFHCPYCHGYELGKGQIGVLGSGPMSAHQAELLTEWGKVTYFPNDTAMPDAQTRNTLEARQVTIEDTRIRRIEGKADIILADGRNLSFAGLFVATQVTPASPLPASAGCEMKETPLGSIIHTDETKQTTVPGIYACGDVAHMPHSVSLAVGDGAKAGAQVHRSLVWPDA